jgi:c(7)-type cytochrome triheme protein
MRFPAALAVVIGLGTAAALLAPTPSPGQVKTPPDFPMEKAESSPGQVVFSHAKHVAKGVKCTACHMRDFKMKRGGSGQITLAAKQEKKFCGACHDGATQMGGATVFPIDECDRCHVP